MRRSRGGNDDSFDSDRRKSRQRQRQRQRSKSIDRERNFRRERSPRRQRERQRQRERERERSLPRRQRQRSPTRRQRQRSPRRSASPRRQRMQRRSRSPYSPRRSPRSRSPHSPQRKDKQLQRSREKPARVEYSMGPDMHLTKHFCFLWKEETSMSYSMAVWNFVITYCKRPALCLIICDNESEMYKLLQFNKLNRKVTILPDHDRHPLKDLLEREKTEILMITTKKASALCALQQSSGSFSLVVNIAFHKDTDHYRKLHEFLLKTGGTIISFITHRKDLERIQRSTGLNFAEVSPTITIDDINKEIIGDIQFMPQPKHENISMLKLLPFGPEAIGARLFQLLQSKLMEGKVSKFLEIPGFVTYQIVTEVEFNSFKYVMNFLKEMPQQIIQNMRSMTKFKNGKGAVFNIPIHLKYQMDHYIRKLGKHQRDNKFQLTIVYDMPEIEDTASAQYKETEEKKSFAMKNKKDLELFVGGLPFKAKQLEIRNFFHKNNVNALTIRLMKDKDGQSKGVCFILCEDKDHVSRALKLDESRFEDKIIRVHVAQRRQRRWD